MAQSSLLWRLLPNMERHWPEWIFVISVKDKRYQTFIETQVDAGEASVIALVQETPNAVILLDDLKARKLATKLHLTFTGSLGIIHKAKQIGIIPAVKPLIDKLERTNFRISENVVFELLRRNHEID